MKLLKAVIITAILLIGLSIPISASAQDSSSAESKSTKKKGDNKENTNTVINKFDLFHSDLFEAYNKAYQMDNDNIDSISNNGGNYSGSPLENALDGDLNTHWETGQANSKDFTNEIEFKLKKATTLNRIVYAARQSNAKGKGFAQAFDIYASSTDKGDDYKLISSGKHEDSPEDIIEIRFKPTKIKRLKFVYKEAKDDWASAAVFQFYKEDSVSEKMEQLFTDDTFTEVNKKFNTTKALDKLEADAKDHPLYDQFKEEIADAKVLIKDETIKANNAKTKPFNHFSNKKYTELFQMDKDNIKRIQNNAGHYGDAVIENAIDGDLETYWETNQANNKDFTNEVEIEFKKTTELNRLTYGARQTDQKGFAEEYDIYVSQTSKGDTYHLLTSGKHKKTDGLVEAKFKPTKIKRVKFKFKNSDQNWATLSEIAFYKKDTIADNVENIFTNGLMNELKPEFDDMKEINKLEKDIADHPLEDELQIQLDLAKELLNNDDDKKEAIVTASQRGDPNATASKHQIARTSFSLDTFGRYISPGETVQVFVDADPNGVMPNLTLGKIANDKNGWVQRYPLSPGLNTITAPEYEKMEPSIIYLENPALPNEQAYAPKVRLVGGTDFPVYYHGETDPKEFEKELEKYVENVSVNDNDFADGKPKDVVYNVAELVSENNTISTSAAGAYKAIQEMRASGKSVSDTMDEWEFIWEKFQEISGNVKDDSNKPYFPAKFTSNVFTQGSYAWSAGGYTGYNGGDSPKRDEGFFKQIVMPLTFPGNDGWAYYHEWGHNINNSQTEHLEVTNNLYATIMMKELNNNYDDRVDWNTLYKRFQGEEVDLDYFTYLGILSQVQYYYGEDSYGKASHVARTNPDGVMDGLDNNLQRLVISFSVATETDLTGFFDDWGYVNATDKMKEKVAHLPEPDVKLEYMHSSGRDYEGDGFTKDAEVNIQSVKTNKEKQEITLNYKIDKANQDAVMGYEILKDEKVIGYTTDTSFVDAKSDPNEAHKYEVVAYDKKLNHTKPVTAESQQPTLSVEDNITLKLNQDYDPMDDVKAITYEGKDITKDVSIKSNNIDTSKKGNYEVVYAVKNEGVEVAKTTKVKVTSDFIYASDMNEDSANVESGGLKKDKAPSDKTITLLRQGMDATYSKGLGTHANSEVVYDIEDQELDFFESYIGIDQAVKGENSSATFEVWIDGKKKYTSDVFKSNTFHEFVRVPVSDAKEVKLVTTDANDNGNTADHTVWADAKFTIESSKPKLTIPEGVATKVGKKIDLDQPYKAIDPEDGDITDDVKVKGIDKVDFNQSGTYHITYSVTDSDDNKVSKKRTVSVVDMDNFKYLSDYNWQSTENSHAAPEKDRSTSDNPLRLTDEDGEEVSYKKGLGTHAESTIIYDLTKINASYLTSYVGVDRQMFDTAGSITFEVHVDDKKEFDSGLMNSTDPQKFFEVNLSGAEELKLVVTDGGNGIGSDHATWGDAKLYFANLDSDVDTTKLEELIEKAKEYKEEDYTKTSYDTLQKAIKKAEDVVEYATTNKEVTKGIDQLQEAIDKLKKASEPEIDTTKLEELIKEAKAFKEKDYTDESFNALQDAIKDAEDVVKNAETDKDVTKGIDQLQEAIDELEKASEAEQDIDTDELEKLIEHAKIYNKDNYTETSFNNLQKGIDQAEDVVKDPNSEKEVKETITLLQEAIDGLEEITEPEPEPEPEPEIDTSELSKLIEQAKVYEQDKYTESSFTALQNAISQAETVKENPETQEEVTEAIALLKKAIDELERITEPEPEPEIDTSELSKLIEHAKVYEQDNFTEPSFTNLQEAISQAENVLQNADTQEEVTEATTMLQTAINDLERVANPDPDPEAELDTTELTKLIEHAKTYEKDNFTESSYTDLQEAISQAENVLQNGDTQEEVTEATTLLQKAINNLDSVTESEPEPEPEVDTTELAKLIEHAKTYEKDNYTEPSYTALQEAISQAENVLQNASTQDEVIEATTLLQNAINNLEGVTEPEPEPEPEPEVDTAELAKLIEHAKTYEEKNYTEASYTDLQEAISQAENVLQNADTQEEVTEATTLLKKAISNLENITEPEPEIDTTELSKLIEKAKAYKKEDYTKKSYKALQKAIKKAEAKVDHATTQEEITDEIALLQEAMDELEEKPESESDTKIDSTKLSKLIDKAKTYKKEDYTKESYKALQKAIKQAEKTIEIATKQEEITKEITLLQDAIDQLEAVSIESKPETEEEEVEKPSTPNNSLNQTETNNNENEYGASQSASNNTSQKEDSITNNEQSSSTTEGTKAIDHSKLPDTATQNYNSLLLGLFLLSVGMFSLIGIRKA